MTSRNKRFVQKAIAVVVIVAVLDVMGVPPLLMMFITGAVFIAWAINHRARNRELEQIFNFYVAADAVLRDEDRSWYGFEVAEIIEDGERFLDTMPDCPSLHVFALGALYYRIGKYEATAEYLSRVVEDHHYDERQHTRPSPELRRYVQMLRRIEANPSLAPQQLAAVKSLERLRRKQATVLLKNSRSLIERQKADVVEGIAANAAAASSGEGTPLVNPVSGRPPISEVLHDVYHDDSSSLN